MTTGITVLATAFIGLIRGTRSAYVGYRDICADIDSKMQLNAKVML